MANLMNNIQKSHTISNEFITDIKEMKLFTVEVDSNTRTAYLKRFKIDRNTTASEIQKVVSLIEKGCMCFKHGNKRTANIRYALTHSQQTVKIEKLVLVKMIKSDISPSGEGKVEKDEVEIDIAIGENAVTDKLEVMSRGEESLLQSIKAKLISLFGLDVIANKATVTAAIPKHRKVTVSVENGPLLENIHSKPQKTFLQNIGTKKTSKKRMAQEEAINQDVRKKKSAAKEISDELDDKFDKKLKKDINFSEKHSEILKDDIKKSRSKSSKVK